MSENKAFDFSVEIDPDYVRQTAPDPNSPARITTKRAWFKSLLIPVLAILASVYPIMNAMVFHFTTFGVIFGGIVPLVMIIRGRIDTSKFFLGKMILLAAAVGEFFLVFFLWFHGSERGIFYSVKSTSDGIATEHSILSTTSSTDGSG